MARNDNDTTGVAATKVRIRRIPAADPVHAQTTGRDTDIDFVDVVGINIGGGQSPSMTEIDLAVDINLRAVSLRINGRSYELSLREVDIILEKENATVRPGTYYKLQLQTGNYEATDTEKTTTTRAAKGDGGVTAEASGGISALIPAFAAKLAGNAAASAEIGRIAEAASQARVAAIVDLVYPGGQDSWVAGGPRGDPRRPDTKDLRGEIITSANRDSLTPLCGLAAIDVACPVTGRISVRVGMTGFKLNGPRDEAEARDALFNSLKKDELAYLERRARAEDALRERVGALALVRNNRKPNSGKIDLASRAFVFEPDIHNETDP